MLVLKIPQLIDSNELYLDNKYKFLSIKIKNDIYNIIFKRFEFYGLMDIIIEWSINDNVHTNVKSKFNPNEFIEYRVENNRYGEREFEHSITYEFLLKSMGVPLELFKKFDIYHGEINLNNLLRMLNISKIKYNLIYSENITWKN